MAALMGKDGSISIGANVVGYMDTWSLNANVGNADITAYGDPVRNYAYTIKEWSGSCAGTLALADAQQITLLAQASTAAFATVALRFNVTTGPTYWGGTAYVKGYNVGSDVGNKVSLSFNFQGTGNLTLTTS
jgi:hypothetical protein